jgi:hypothetical protein
VTAVRIGRVFMIESKPAGAAAASSGSSRVSKEPAIIERFSITSAE